MAKEYKTPGVYVEEIPKLPPSVAQPDSAVPCFIGYTQTGEKLVAVKILSLLDFQQKFGGAAPEKNISVTIEENIISVQINAATISKNIFFYAMQLYFNNGGGTCYVIPAGNFTDAGNNTGIAAYSAALNILSKAAEPTLIVFPDAPYWLNATGYYTLMKTALAQCKSADNCFLIMDVLNNNNDLTLSVKDFRDNMHSIDGKYGAAYFPYIQTNLPYAVDTGSITINGISGAFSNLPADVQNKVQQKIAEQHVMLTPCSAVAGVYVMTDITRGVWKAPANISIASATDVSLQITDTQHSDLNVDAIAGLSVNAIRKFAGKGILIWGARTMDGNSNEWRYISVRRFFSLVETSVKHSTLGFVFEPNDANTWAKVKAMIENYLVLLWRQGALAGATPENAFFVHIGLGETMTALDVLEGRMICEIGMAVVRPAEFIILRFSHKMAES